MFSSFCIIREPPFPPAFKPMPEKLSASWWRVEDNWTLNGMNETRKNIAWKLKTIFFGTRDGDTYFRPLLFSFAFASFVCVFIANFISRICQPAWMYIARIHVQMNNSFYGCAQTQTQNELYKFVYISPKWHNVVCISVRTAHALGTVCVCDAGWEWKKKSKCAHICWNK